MSDILDFIFNHPLSSRQKFRSVLRFILWQLVSRLAPGNHVYKWVNGCRFHVRKGETGLTGNIYTGLHEFEDMGFLLHFLRKEDFFADIGANSGSYTLLASGVIGAKSIAFEPDPGTFMRLDCNVRLNRIDSLVDCRNIGIGAESGQLDFSTGNDTTNRVLKAGETGKESIIVGIDSLDSILEHLGTPALIKIDVEGFETKVIEGADKTLRDPGLHAVIMELNGSGNFYGFDEKHLIETMSAYGFSAFRYDPWTRKLDSIEGGNNDTGNTLFLRDTGHVLERLKSAQHFRVCGLEI